MTGYFTFNRHLFWTFRVYLLCGLLIFLASGCGNDNSAPGTSDNIASASTETGSASFAIQWNTSSVERASTVVKQAIENCETAGVASITCTVYDESNNPIASGGPWNCSDHQGTIEQIPAGSNRTFAALGWNAAGGDGNIIYQGQTGNNLTINPGGIVDAGTIDAYAFIPMLYAPENNAQVDSTNVSLEWELLENADEYLVQVAEDDAFETTIVDETTPAATYSPSTLEPSKEYFWKISAVDIHDNIGAESEVRSFVTSAGPGPVISGYVRTSSGTGISGVTVTFSNNGGSATASSSGYFSNTVDYGWSGTVTPSASGYTFSPPSRTYENVAADQSDQNFTGTQQTGSLQVTILPAAAISADARWRVDGGTWRSSGYMQADLSVGNHTVEFNTISGWTSPGNQTVNITNNNTTSASGTYNQLPDYLITEFSSSSTFIFAGLSVDLTSTIANQGGTPTACINIGIYLSTNATITTADTLLADWSLKPCNVAPGGTYRWSMSVTIPENTATGYYFIGIIADVNQDETESNENNNTRASQQVYIYHRY
jgi:hypothetical protein